MVLRRLIWWLSDIVWLYILGGLHIKSDYKNRCRLVIETLLTLLDSSEPYVIDGKWSWYISSSVHPPITIIFTDLPLAVQVYGPEVGSWETCRKYCKNKRAWEAANEAESTLRLTCKEIGLPLVPIYWNDPVDAISLKIVLDQALSKKE
jgi:hypothetical protein